MAGTAPLTSLKAVTAAGNGITFDVQKAHSDWAVQITTTGSPASFACHLEGALDGSTLVTVGSSITATGLTIVTGNQPLTMVRLVLDSLTGGTAPTVTGVIAGDGPAGSGGSGGGSTNPAAPNAVELSDGTNYYTAAKTGQFPAALVGGRTDVNVGASALPTGAATETTLAGIKTGTDKIPASPATDRTTAAAPASVELSDGAAFYTGAKTGQFPAALVGGRTDVNVGASALPTGAATETTLAGIKTGTDKIPASPATDRTTAAAPGSVELSDGAAFYTAAKTGQLPSALVSGRLDVNLGAAPATVTAQGTAAAGSPVSGNPVLTGMTDGTNVQTAKQTPLNQGAVTPTGVPLVAIGLLNGTSDLRIMECGLGASGNSSLQNINVAPQNYNGANYDATRNNLDVSLHGSAVTGTGTVNTDIITYNLRYLIIHANVTLYNGGTVLFKVQMQDANGIFADIPNATTGAVAAGGDIFLFVGPSSWPANATPVFYANTLFGRQIRIVQTVAGASVTFSATYSLLPA